MAKPIPPLTDSDVERLFAKIEERNGHWLWTAYFDKRRGCTLYVKTEGLPKSKSNYAVTRILWTLFHGDIPEGYEVDVTCNEDRCVNPDHLVISIHPEIMENHDTVIAMQLEKTGCNAGHTYTEETTYFDDKGKKHCRLCKQERLREWRKRQEEGYWRKYQSARG